MGPVPFNRNPFFPVNTLALMRGAAAAQIDGSFERYHPAVYKAMWVDGRNLNDLAEVAKVLTEAGLDARDRQPHPGAGRQGPAEGHDGRSGCPRRVRCPDELRVTWFLATTACRLSRWR